MSIFTCSGSFTSILFGININISIIKINKIVVIVFSLLPSPFKRWVIGRGTFPFLLFLFLLFVLFDNNSVSFICRIKSRRSSDGSSPSSSIIISIGKYYYVLRNTSLVDVVCTSSSHPLVLACYHLTRRNLVDLHLDLVSIHGYY